MKKSTTLGLIATFALTFSPLAAFAQSFNGQHNIQGGTQTNAAVGAGNSSHQIGILNSDQQQVNVNGSDYPTVNNQVSVQDLLQEQALIGDHNDGQQVGVFDNSQHQLNVNPSVPYYYPGY